MIAHDRYGDGSVMVWVGITTTGKIELHIYQGNVSGLYYRDNVIEPVVVPYARRHGNAVIFQDDNARTHCARVPQYHLHIRRITTLQWPAKFQDLSPTEHLWGIFGRRVQRRPQEPQDINELAEVLQEEWRRIPQATIKGIISSMRHDCLACLAATGDPSHY